MNLYIVIDRDGAYANAYTDPIDAIQFYQYCYERDGNVSIHPMTVYGAGRGLTIYIVCASSGECQKSRMFPRAYLTEAEANEAIRTFLCPEGACVDCDSVEILVSTIDEEVIDEEQSDDEGIEE